MFFNQWVRSNKYLELELTDSGCVKQDDDYLCTLTIEYTGSLMMPVPIRVHFTDGTYVDLKTNRFNRIQKIECRGSSPLKNVQIDPEHQLPIFPERVMPSAKDLEKIVLALPYADVGNAADRPYQLAVEIDSDRIRTWFHLGLRLYESGKNDQSFDCFKRGQDLARQENDTSYLVTTNCWMGIIYDLSGKREQALACYQAALKYHYDGTFKFDQFGLTIDPEWIKERLNTPYKK